MDILTVHCRSIIDCFQIINLYMTSLIIYLFFSRLFTMDHILYCTYMLSNLFEQTLFINLLTLNSMTSVMISISVLSIFLFLAVTCLHLLLMAYMFHNLYVMQELPQNTFLHRGKLLTNKLLTHGYCKPRLIKTIKKFYGRHHEIVDKFGVSVSKMILDVFETQ